MTTFKAKVANGFPVRINVTSAWCEPPSPDSPGDSNLEYNITTMEGRPLWDAILNKITQKDYERIEEEAWEAVINAAEEAKYAQAEYEYEYEYESRKDSTMYL